MKFILFLSLSLALAAYAGAQMNTFPTTGNVGIGTTSPLTNLDVLGGFHTVINTQAIAPSFASGGLYLSWNRTGGQAEVNFCNVFNNAVTSYLFTQKTGASTYTDLMAILGNGSVGIGTTTPAATLDVTGSFHTGVNTQAIPPNYAAGGLYVGGNRTNGQAEVNFYNVYNSAATSYIFSQKTGATTYVDLMTLFGNGNVGIGTSNAGTARLAVEGTIETRKVVVTQALPFPDYVFHPWYVLPSLDSVAGYIAANHHLPDMPSADSIARTGLDLGANQVAMVRKIEELTLYIIDQNKRMQQKDRQLEEQENRLKDLDERVSQLEKKAPID
jgi:hypothetical protein